MNITKEEVQGILDALSTIVAGNGPSTKAEIDAITLLQSKMAEPDAEPMTAMVDAAMVEMRNIVPPLRRSECQRLIKAALSTHPSPKQAPMTDEDLEHMHFKYAKYQIESMRISGWFEFGRAVEARFR